MIIELTPDQKIEQARSRLRTAYDLYINSGMDDPKHQQYKEKWLTRKTELQSLLTPKIQYNE